VAKVGNVDLAFRTLAGPRGTTSWRLKDQLQGLCEAGSPYRCPPREAGGPFERRIVASCGPATGHGGFDAKAIPNNQNSGSKPVCGGPRPMISGTGSAPWRSRIYAGPPNQSGSFGSDSVGITLPSLLRFSPVPVKRAPHARPD
jgi:hypothetical protein